MRGEYTVVFEIVGDFQRPNFSVYVEDPQDRDYLKFLCYKRFSIECKIPQIERVAKKTLEEVFADFEIKKLDSLKGLFSEVFAFDNMFTNRQPTV